MTCRRCDGTMLQTNLYSVSECLCVEAVSCVNCGECIDEVIMKNRLSPPEPEYCERGHPQVEGNITVKDGSTECRLCRRYRKTKAKEQVGCAASR